MEKSIRIRKKEIEEIWPDTKLLHCDTVMVRCVPGHRTMPCADICSLLRWILPRYILSEILHFYHRLRIWCGISDCRIHRAWRSTLEWGKVTIVHLMTVHYGVVCVWLGWHPVFVQLGGRLGALTRPWEGVGSTWSMHVGEFKSLQKRGGLKVSRKPNIGQFLEPTMQGRDARFLWAGILETDPMLTRTIILSTKPWEPVLCFHWTKLLPILQEERDRVLRHVGQNWCSPLQWKQHRAGYSLWKVLPSDNSQHYWPRYVVERQPFVGPPYL